MKTVLVTVGTDHHPFDRLMDWVTQIRESTTGVRFVVQHGTTTPPQGVEAHSTMSPEDLAQVMSACDAVVTHGGPGSIFDARSAGHVPVVVPRESRFGEHVDDHQVRFGTRIASDGAVRLARTQPEFDDAVAAALADGRQSRSSDTDHAVDDAVARFSALVDRLMQQRRPG